MSTYDDEDEIVFDGSNYFIDDVSKTLDSSFVGDFSFISGDHFKKVFSFLEGIFQRQDEFSADREFDARCGVKYPYDWD